MGPSATEEFHIRLEAAGVRTRTALLAARNASGHWSGELSSSALSTATAVSALALAATNDPAAEALITGGLTWLAAQVNRDGGWGDTDRSPSNLSTTALVWAAFGMRNAERGTRVQTRNAERGTRNEKGLMENAERWIARAAGNLEPATLVAAIESRYGKDRTFSVPILMMCALGSRLGEDRMAAWRWVKQLPFEMAALPHQFFGALRLPVVSYALPALIAIGQARHYHAPSTNPLARSFRSRTAARTLKVLQTIQPPNGGFLEATPLTSFVTAALASMDLCAHQVVQRGVEFLKHSVRADGSWPIDTNLATWVTTLSIKALAASGGMDGLDAADRQGLCDWLLDQQGQTEHPYTHAAAGGWGWTDLPGGVPDADDTAGALLALHHLGETGDPRVAGAARAGARWLENLQNRDGGIPTFCRGWGALPFDRSGPDLTAHALRAWSSCRGAASVQSDRAIAAGVRYLQRTQAADGSWTPLWFGNHDAPDEANRVYGTAHVLLALTADEIRSRMSTDLLVENGVRWLLRAQHETGGWGGFCGGLPSIEESSLAISALSAARERPALRSVAEGSDDVRTAIRRGVEWMMRKIETDDWETPAPIGFYFARLWYYERLYPLIFATEALGRVQRCLGA